MAVRKDQFKLILHPLKKGPIFRKNEVNENKYKCNNLNNSQLLYVLSASNIQ